MRCDPSGSVNCAEFLDYRFDSEEGLGSTELGE
jgi:hypothetical protein